MILFDNIYIKEVDKYITLHIEKQLNILTGKNGIGKTLLFDQISGIQSVKKGSITGNSDSVYLNQSIYFSDRLKLKELFKFLYRLEGIKDYKTYFAQFICQYDINVADDLEKPFGLLSGGEKKFWYALIILSLDRQWYLLDEPFAAVDKDRKNILSQIIAEKANKQKGVILSTHEEIDFKSCEINYIDLDALLHN